MRAETLIALGNAQRLRRHTKRAEISNACGDVSALTFAYLAERWHHEWVRCESSVFMSS